MLKEFKNVENLIYYLNITLAELNEIIDRIKDYKEYYNYIIPKRNGSYRLISALSDKLKKIQRKLLISFNNIYNRKKCSFGFEKNRNNKDCASNHCRKKYICTIDLKDFFNQITSYRIFGMLVNKPYEINDKVCSVLVDLICRDGKLHKAHQHHQYLQICF